MAAYSLNHWKTILPLLAPWRDLNVDQRVAVLELTSGFQTLPPALAALPASKRLDFFEKDLRGRHRPHPEFRRLADFVDRLGQWSRPDRIDMTIYVQQTTTYPQRHALTGVRAGGVSDIAAAALEHRMQEGWFTRQWLERNSHDAFLAAVSGWMPEEVVLTSRHFEVLRSWLRESMERGIQGFYLNAGTFEVPKSKIPPEELLYLALAYGLAQIVRHPDTLDVVVQILQPEVKVAQDPERIEMRKLVATQTFSRPYLIDDMEVYLRAVKSDPAPLLSDGSHVPVAHHRKVARQFLVLPEPKPRAGFQNEDRAKAAWWFIAKMGLVAMSGRGRKNWKAGLEAKGEAWLALGRDRKLETLLAEAPFGSRKKWLLGDRFSWLGEYDTLPLPYPALNSRLFDRLDAIVSKLLDPAAFQGLLTSAAGHANPLLADLDTDPYLPGQWARWDRSPQTVFAEFLCHYLGRLSSLGAVALCTDSEGNLGVSLTGIGLHQFGHSQSWALVEEARRIAVVGGDFSIVLLEPAPELTLELARFADPVGGDPGNRGLPLRPRESGPMSRPIRIEPPTEPPSALHFRMTRRSVQAGAHQGLTAQDMLRVLKAWSKTALPANVVHELEAWCGSKPTVRLSETILVEGEDPIVMADILSRFPKDFLRISPTVLKYLGEGKRAALLNRLAKKGFFTE